MPDLEDEKKLEKFTGKATSLQCDSTQVEYANF